MPLPDHQILARIAAALDADPFADPVSVCGVALPRKEARRFERELVAKLYPAPSGRTAGSDTTRPGHFAKLNSARFHGPSSTSQEQQNHGC